MSRVLRSVAALSMLVGVLVAPTGTAGAAAGDIGYEGPSYSGVSGSHPSQEKPESKLWYHDGSWWGSLWSNPAGAFTVHQLDAITHAWTDTGTVLESSGNYRQDTLFDGSKLYVASHRYSTSSRSATARLTRLSYQSATHSWSVDAGFPATISDAGSETLTIDKDSNGRLWATWTTSGEVWVNHTTCTSSCDDAAWATPFRLSTIGSIGSAATTSSDDISAVVAFGGKIGVYWSNQLDNASYFAMHDDGASTTTWSLETALSGTDISDDHINLATDGANVFAAVKTSYDSSSQPETFLVKRSAAGSWSAAETSDGGDRLTRPIVTYDQLNDRVHWFATDVSGGYAYTKDAPAASPSFSAGKGTPVMFDASAADVNDVSSTKQAVDPSTGLVVLATDNVSKTYWHHEDNLGGSAFITAGFTAAPQFGEAPVDVQFTDVSIGDPTSWSWDFGDGGTSVDQNPLHTYTVPGVYTVSLTATSAEGSDIEVKTNFVEIVAPQPLEATFTTDPARGSAPLNVQFTDTSPGTPTTWSWDFGDGSSSTDQHPSHVYSSIGTYDVTLTVTNDQAESSTTTVAGAVVVTDELAFAPVADAFVRADRPTNNYGSETFLRVRNAASGYRSLVKFDVQGTSSAPVNATLRMFVEDGSPHAGDLYVVDSSWTEPGVTDGNAPLPGSTPGATGGPAELGTWHEWDVTSLISGDGVYSFMVVSTSGNSAYFSSREGTNPPELVVTTASTAPLAAAFAADQTTVEVDQPVNFSDLSTGLPTSWSWTFGDGAVSTEQHPQHAYAAPGTYTVSLTVGDGETTDAATSIDYITVTPPQPLDASFLVDAPSGSAPHIVNFTDTSTGAPTSWSWQFGDGGTSIEQHPQHTYASPGVYDVTLTVGDGTTTNAEIVSSAVTVSADSVVTAVADSQVRSNRADKNYGTLDQLRIRQASTEYRSLVKFDVPSIPTTVTNAVVRMFVDDASPSAGDLHLVDNGWEEQTVTWANQPTVAGAPVALGGPAVAGVWHEWDVTSVLSGASPGTFSFTLVGNSGNSAYFSSREGVNPPQLVIEGVVAPPALAAEFSGTPVSGSAPLTVAFTDLSTGPAATSWSWDFGDGVGSSSLQNPTYEYTLPGLYSVSLTVGDGVGSDTITKTGYIDVSAPPSGPSTFTAIEDAYVKNERPDNNYGSDSWLRLRQSTSIYESLLKFDVSGLAGAPSSAVLRLWVTDPSPSAGAVHSVDPATWSESTVTFNTRPSPIAAIADDQEAPAAGQWVEWDVTAGVTGNGLVSFSLSSTSGNSVYFDSREAANPPQLVITP